MLSRPLSPLQLVILRTLRRAGRPLPTVEVAERVYATQQDGGPEYGLMVIRVMIHRMRKRLAAHDIRILTVGGRGKGSLGYLIDPADAARADAMLSANLSRHLTCDPDRTVSRPV